MSPPAVHQLTPTLAWGDAVGNQARLLRRWFTELDYSSQIYAGRTDERSRKDACPADSLPGDLRQGDLVLVHHSIQSRFVPLLQRVQRRARVAVLYHNVTPPSLVQQFDPPLAAACAAGLEELRPLAGLAEVGLAFSEFSAQDLRLAGFGQVRVIPFPMELAALDAAPEPSLLAELCDGCTNVLFVGRGAPNKRLDALLQVFTAYQRLYNPKSRLVLAGALDREEPYGAWVHAVRDLLRPERVHILGRVDEAQLSACYAAASVYVSTSTHEGFGVPLVEALHRGVPVIAFAAGAVEQTLGGAGWVCRRDDPVAFAQLLAVLERNPGLRAQLVALGHRRVADFAPERTRPALLEALGPLPAAAEASKPRRRAR